MILLCVYLCLSFMFYMFHLSLPYNRNDEGTCWGLVLKCYESRTRQHKMLNTKALRPSNHYFPSDITNLGRRS
jgi:hypothetical protein